MANSGIEKKSNNNINHITAKDIQIIISEYINPNEDAAIESYSVKNASNEMLGFLAEYLRIQVRMRNGKVLNFFIKAISRTNIAKAEMVREMKLFDAERMFYSIAKKRMEISGLRAWSAVYVTALDDAIVFEDLIAKQYKLKNKFERFDMAHTMQALKTLARFHATSIIFEENRKNVTHNSYKITDEYPELIGMGGYHMSSEWYIQCMVGALEGLKSFSHYKKSTIKIIESRWHNVWATALDMHSTSSKQKNVICHRDLWNNNIMFHYKKEDENELSPDDCLFVDFQAIRYQPLTSDVMVLLCCNLDPKFREQNMEIFLIFYYKELQKILGTHGIKINDILTKEEFMTSAEEQTKWGLVVCACLIPQFWIDDDLTTRIFCDNIQFNDVLCKNKGLFIKKIMEDNYDYREKVMEIFEEIANRYCLYDVIKL